MTGRRAPIISVFVSVVALLTGSYLTVATLGARFSCLWTFPISGLDLAFLGTPILIGRVPVIASLPRLDDLITALCARLVDFRA